MPSLFQTLATVAVAAGTALASSGSMTWYDPNGVGSCGSVLNSNQAVVALSAADYAVFGEGRLCGKWITIRANGRQTAAQVQDKCPGCRSGDIDVARVIFDDIADPAVGRVQVEWFFQ